MQPSLVFFGIDSETAHATKPNYQPLNEQIIINHSICWSIFMDALYDSDTLYEAIPYLFFVKKTASNGIHNCACSVVPTLSSADFPNRSQAGPWLYFLSQGDRGNGER